MDSDTLKNIAAELANTAITKKAAIDKEAEINWQQLIAALKQWWNNGKNDPIKTGLITAGLGAGGAGLTSLLTGDDDFLGSALTGGALGGLAGVGGSLLWPHISGLFNGAPTASAAPAKPAIAVDPSNKATATPPATPNPAKPAVAQRPPISTESTMKFGSTKLADAAPKLPTRELIQRMSEGATQQGPQNRQGWSNWIKGQIAPTAVGYGLLAKANRGFKYNNAINRWFNTPMFDKSYMPMAMSEKTTFQMTPELHNLHAEQLRNLATAGKPGFAPTLGHAEMVANKAKLMEGFNKMGPVRKALYSLGVPGSFYSTEPLWGKSLSKSLGIGKNFKNLSLAGIKGIGRAWWLLPLLLPAINAIRYALPGEEQR